MDLQKLFQENCQIASSEILLRSVREQDADALFPMYSDNSIYQYRPGMPRNTVLSVQKALRRLCAERQQKKQAAFTVLDRDGEIVGLTEVFHIDARVEQVEIGYTITPIFQGRGIATAVVGCITDYLLLNIGLNRVYAPVHKDNINSKKVLLKNDFTYEGTVRQGEFWQGIGFVDVCVFSKLREDCELYSPKQDI